MKVRRYGYRVHVVPLGRAEFPRWRLRDSANRYWTGSGWTQEAKKGLLYASPKLAETDQWELTLNAKPKQFITSVTVIVDPSRDFTIEELRNYLQRHFKWRVTNDGGISSLDTACIHFEVRFQELGEQQ